MSSRDPGKTQRRVCVFPGSPENPEKSIDYVIRYYCIEGIKYCKRLIARDYLIIPRALEKNIRNI